MQITEEQVKDALSYVIEPDLKKDLVTLDLISNIQIKDNEVSFDVKISNPALHNRKRVMAACEHQIHAKISEGVKVTANVTAMPRGHERAPEHRTVLPGVKHIIAVASGKGGVGKSTVAANIAAGLAAEGHSVGLVDADIYGPSMPSMFDVLDATPGGVEIDGEKMMKPVESYGVKLLSIGFFSTPDQAVVWRGPMTVKALTQMFKNTHWGELDYMIIDLPPGTGDIHLSLVQQVPLSGAIIVSTPQEIALVDVRRALGMFKMAQINVPVLGLVENMAYFTPEELPENKYYIFGKEGGKALAEKVDINYLGEIPIVQSIREAGDVGRPVVLQGDTVQANAFQKLIGQMKRALERVDEEKKAESLKL